MYISPFGKSEGLADRLDKWEKDLSANRTYPWVGLGLLADLRAAAATIRGEAIPVDPFEEVDYDL